MEYYEVDLANSRDYDYTKGNTVTIAVTANHYPNADDIEEFLRKANHIFSHLKVCNIVELISDDDIESVIPYVEEVVDMEV